jgi:lipid A 3-O-deacylase
MTSRPWVACLASLLLLLGGWPSPGSAQWTDQGPVLTIIEENDLAVDTDRHYTQGFKISYLQADGDVPRWARRLAESLPALGASWPVTKFGYHLGQSIFTPAELNATQPLKHDRPYAGWLYAGLILQRRGTLGESRVLESFQFDVGIIGPDSLAEDAQKRVHEFRGFDTPKGWRNQLHDEPGLALKYQRSWLLSPTREGPRYLDLIPQAGLSVGNVETSLRGGATVRAGWNLPDDFGHSTISSLTPTQGGRSHAGPRWGAYVFAGAEAWAVLYTAFLDGNLFRHSPRVERELAVAEVKSGVVAVLDCLEVAVTYVYRTPEFRRQQKDLGYGSVSLSVKF